MGERFKRKKRDSFETPGSTEVIYKEEGSEFYIKADASGIRLFGNSLPITTQADMHSLAEAIGKAGCDYVALKNELRKRLSATPQ